MTFCVWNGADVSVILAVPLWELAGNLQDLELSIFLSEAHVDLVGEHDEAELASFELPESLPTDGEEMEVLHAHVASRTIIAAARGGQLRRLSAGSEHDLEPPFTNRALLPYWIDIEEWDVQGGAYGWMIAASTLRRLLAHASLWINTEPHAAARQDRHLACQDIQLLDWLYSDDNMPSIAPLRDDMESQPVEFYLPWLERDAALAQQVADAWNVVLERGGADDQPCRCSRCQDYLGWRSGESDADETSDA